MDRVRGECGVVATQARGAAMKQHFRAVALKGGNGDRWIVIDRDRKRRRGPCSWQAAQKWIEKQLLKQKGWSG